MLAVAAAAVEEEESASVAVEEERASVVVEEEWASAAVVEVKEEAEAAVEQEARTTLQVALRRHLPPHRLPLLLPLPLRLPLRGGVVAAVLLPGLLLRAVHAGRQCPQNQPEEGGQEGDGSAGDPLRGAEPGETRLHLPPELLGRLGRLLLLEDEGLGHAPLLFLLQPPDAGQGGPEHRLATLQLLGAGRHLGDLVAVLDREVVDGGERLGHAVRRLLAGAGDHLLGDGGRLGRRPDLLDEPSEGLVLEELLVLGGRLLEGVLENKHTCVCVDRANMRLCVCERGMLMHEKTSRHAKKRKKTVLTFRS